MAEQSLDRILYLEDGWTRELTKKFIEGLGYQVDLVTNIQDAELALAQNRYHAAVLDNSVPNIPFGPEITNAGLSLAYRMLKYPNHPLRIALATNSSFQSWQLKDMESVGITYISKSDMIEMFKEFLKK